MAIIDEPLTQSATTSQKINSMIDVSVGALSNEMVNGLSEKMIKAVEIADDVLQPETIELLKLLPSMADSLSDTLTLLKKLQDSGTLDTIVQLASMVDKAKGALTGMMVNDLGEKAIKAVEFTDDLLQRDTLKYARSMVYALDEAVEESTKVQDPGIGHLLKQMKEPEVRQGLSMMLTFLKKLTGHLQDRELA